MASPRTSRLTPAGLYVLEHTWRGRVRCDLPGEDILLRPLGGIAKPPAIQKLIDETRSLDIEVTGPFLEIGRAGLVWIEPWDIHNPPQWTACWVTLPDGEDALMEARQAERKRKEAR